MNRISRSTRAAGLRLLLALALTGCSARLYAGGGEEGTPEDVHESPHVVLTPAQIRRAGIELATVAAGEIRETLSVYGAITANPEQRQEVRARFDGLVRNIHMRVGDPVRRGDVLATIEADESMQTYTIVAAIDGVVTRREANAGEPSAGRTLLVVEDLSAVWVELELFPRDLPRVQAGDPVTIRSRTDGLAASGEVAYIAPLASAGSRTVTARVVLANPQGRWFPGQFVEGDITLSLASAALVVDNRALQTLERDTVVFVETDEGFEPRPVRLGRGDTQYSEVLEGLRAGETYVADNSFILKSELGKEDADHGH